MPSLSDPGTRTFAPVVAYPLWIGGMQVTSANAANIAMMRLRWTIMFAARPARVARQSYAVIVRQSLKESSFLRNCADAPPGHFPI